MSKSRNTKAKSNNQTKQGATTAAPQAPSIIDMASKSMLVWVGTSKVGATKKDQGATKAAISQMDASDDAGGFSKRLFPKKTPAIAAVESAFNRALDIYETETLPWLDGGGRLLLNTNYLRFAEKIRQAKADIDSAVDALALVWDDLVAAQAARLGKMFNLADYPKAHELKDIYALHMKRDAVPTGDDFRVKLAEEIVEEIRAQIDQRAKECFEDAMNECYARLWDQTSHVVKILNSPDPKRSIKDVLIDNVRSAVEAIPRFNIANDQRLIDKGNEILAQLCAYDGATLRGNDAVRASVAAKASEISEELRQIVGIEEAPAQPETPKAPKAKPEKAKGKGKQPKSEPQPEPQPEVMPPAVTLAQADQIAWEMGALFGPALSLG